MTFHVENRRGIATTLPFLKNMFGKKCSGEVGLIHAISLFKRQGFRIITKNIGESTLIEWAKKVLCRSNMKHECNMRLCF